VAESGVEVLDDLDRRRRGDVAGDPDAHRFPSRRVERRRRALGLDRVQAGRETPVEEDGVGALAEHQRERDRRSGGYRDVAEIEREFVGRRAHVQHDEACRTQFRAVIGAGARGEQEGLASGGRRPQSQ
jgi:hypothetical protein